MRHPYRCLFLLMSALLLSSCYPQKDEMALYTFGPGSRVQTIFFDHNIRLYPPEQQPDPEQEREYLRRFLAGEDDRSRALKKAGGEQIERKVLQERHPLSTLLSAKFRSVDLLVDFWKQQSDEHIKFTLNEAEGFTRLTVEIREGDEKERSASSESRYVSSVTKFAFEGYKISESQGFIVSPNQLSALLDLDYILKELNENKKVTFFITWVPFTSSLKEFSKQSSARRRDYFLKK